MQATANWQAFHGKQNWEYWYSNDKSERRRCSDTTESLADGFYNPFGDNHFSVGSSYQELSKQTKNAENGTSLSNDGMDNLTRRKSGLVIQNLLMDSIDRGLGT